MEKPALDTALLEDATLRSAFHALSIQGCIDKHFIELRDRYSLCVASTGQVVLAVFGYVVLLNAPLSSDDPDVLQARQDATNRLKDTLSGVYRVSDDALRLMEERSAAASETAGATAAVSVLPALICDWVIGFSGFCETALSRCGTSLVMRCVGAEWSRYIVDSMRDGHVPSNRGFEWRLVDSPQEAVLLTRTSLTRHFGSTCTKSCQICCSSALQSLLCSKKTRLDVLKCAFVSNGEGGACLVRTSSSVAAATVVVNDNNHSSAPCGLLDWTQDNRPDLAGIFRKLLLSKELLGVEEMVMLVTFGAVLHEGKGRFTASSLRIFCVSISETFVNMFLTTANTGGGASTSPSSSYASSFSSSSRATSTPCFLGTREQMEQLELQFKSEAEKLVPIVNHTTATDDEDDGDYGTTTTTTNTTGGFSRTRLLLAMRAMPYLQFGEFVKALVRAVTEVIAFVQKRATVIYGDEYLGEPRAKKRRVNEAMRRYAFDRAWFTKEDFMVYVQKRYPSWDPSIRKVVLMRMTDKVARPVMVHFKSGLALVLQRWQKYCASAAVAARIDPFYFLKVPLSPMVKHLLLPKNAATLIILTYTYFAGKYDCDETFCREVLWRISEELFIEYHRDSGSATSKTDRVHAVVMAYTFLCNFHELKMKYRDKSKSFVWELHKTQSSQEKLVLSDQKKAMTAELTKVVVPCHRPRVA